MNRGIFKSIMGTIDACPYAPRSKQVIVPEVAGALVSGGASLLGNLLGFGSNENANQTNLEIAKMNNAQQYKMFQEQMAYNTEMWIKQNKYNSPKESVQRLLAAGINPAAVYGSGSVTPAGQLTAPNAPNLQQAHVSPFMPDMSGVGQAVNSFYQNQLINAEKRKTEAEQKHTEFLTLEGNKKLLPTLKFLEEQAKKEGVLGDIARSQLSYAQDAYYWNLKHLRNEVRAQDDSSRLMAKQTYAQELQNGLMEVQLAYQPRMSEAELRQYYLTGKQIIANIGLINANATLSNQQRLTEIERTASEAIERGLKGFDLKLKQGLKKYIINDAKNNSYLLGKEAEDYNASWWNRTIQGYIPFASGSATQATRHYLKP